MGISRAWYTAVLMLRASAEVPDLVRWIPSSANAVTWLLSIQVTVGDLP